MEITPEEAGFGKLEELDADLKMSLVQKGALSVIQHPYVVGLYVPALAGHYNRSLAHKRDAITKAIQERDLETYVFLHEKPYRVDALKKGIKLFGPSNRTKLAEIIVGAWSMCEWPSPDRHDWLNLFKSHVRDSSLGVAARKIAPRKLYRGVDRDERRTLGLSWSADRDCAIWFAKRSAEFFKGRALLYSVRVDKDVVMAMCGDRDEREFIVDSTNLHLNTTLRLSAV